MNREQSRERITVDLVDRYVCAISGCSVVRLVGARNNPVSKLWTTAGQDVVG